MEALKRTKEIPSFEEIREAMCDLNFGKSWDDFSNDKSILYVTVLALSKIAQRDMLFYVPESPSLIGSKKID